MNYTTKLCEYMLSNIHEDDQEFNYSSFSNHIDKQKRWVKLTYISDLSMVKEDTLIDYKETLTDFITTSKTGKYYVEPYKVK